MPSHSICPIYHCATPYRAQKAVGLPCAPSTGMDAPLIQLARSDERNTTTSATSKSVPSRCAGNSRVRNISYSSGVSFWKRAQPPPGKRSEPGQTVLTRMLWAANSHASAPARNISAALVAPYCAPLFAGFQPEMEEMVTILPPSLFFMCGTATRLARTA